MSEGVKFKGSARMSDAAMVRRLEGALETMAGAPCTFWACEGPKRPKHMLTCSQCWAIRDVAVVLAALRRRAGVGAAGDERDGNA